MAFALLLMLLVGVVSAQNVPQPVEPTVAVQLDLERVTAALAEAGEWTTSYYTVSYTRERYDSGAHEDVVIDGTMDADGLYTSAVTREGKVLLKLGDKPWGGFISDLLGRRLNFNIWVNCNTPTGAVYGGFYAAKFPNGARIILDLRPGWVLQPLLFSANGLDPNTIRLRLANGGIYYYDADLGGFLIWVDPMAVDAVDYQIYQVLSDGSRVILKNDSVRYGDGNDPSELSSATTSRFPGGIMKGYLDRYGSCSIPEMPFVSDVRVSDDPDDTTTVKGALLFSNAHGQPFGIQIYDDQVTVVVRDTRKGMNRAVIIPEQTIVYPGDDYWPGCTQILLPAGIEGMSIRITPNIQGSTHRPDLYLNGTPAPTPTDPTTPGGGGGGGKGSPEQP